MNEIQYKQVIFFLGVVIVAFFIYHILIYLERKRKL